MLKLPSIERRAKTVEKARSWRVSVKLTAAQKAAVDEVLDCIEAGHELPSWAYRKYRSTTPDELLDGMGVMHLHLCDGSRELLFLAQYDDRVVLLEISDHYPLTDTPRGAVLRGMHGAALKEIEKEEAEKATLRAAAKTDEVRRSLGKPAKPAKD